MSVLIRGLTLDHMITECLRVWSQQYPDQVTAVKRFVDNMRGIQKNDNATSDQFEYIGEIPDTLWAIMAVNISPTWHSDPQVRNVFWRYFTVGRVKRRHASESRR